jgi:hypothetical protein
MMSARAMGGVMAVAVAGIAGCWVLKATPLRAQQDPADLAELESQRNGLMADELATAFPNAPAAVQDVARMIRAGEVPTAEVLAALGLQTLNQSWSQPFADDLPEMGHTLLRQAVQSRNVAAAGALITAGADAFYNQNEMPFAAVQMDDSPDQYWFPDFRRGNSLLSLWIAAGGNVNTARFPGSSLGPLLVSTIDHNLEGILLLLAAGADPWLTVVLDINTDGSEYRSDSFAQKHANADLLTNEVAFRVARLGYYRNGPPDQVADVMFMYDRTAQQYLGSTGPDNLHTIWAMQKVLPLILEQTGQSPTPAIAALLATPIPEGIGGFFLGASETRSPEVPGQLVRDDNQSGTQMWHD